MVVKWRENGRLTIDVGVNIGKIGFEIWIRKEKAYVDVKIVKEEGWGCWQGYEYLEIIVDWNEVVGGALDEEMGVLVTWKEEGIGVEW